MCNVSAGIHVFAHVSHEFLADRADVGRQGGREHHDLLVMGGALENCLHVGTHFDGFEALVALVNHKVTDVAQVQGLLICQGLDATRGSHNDGGALGRVLEGLALQLDGQTAEEVAHADVLHVGGETFVLVANLESQLTSVAEHQHGHLPVHGLNLLQGGNHKNGGLAHAGLGLADNIHTKDGLRDALVLDCNQDGGKAKVIRKTD